MANSEQDYDLTAYNHMMDCLKSAVLALNADPDCWILAVVVQDVIGALGELKYEIKWGSSDDDPFSVPAISDSAAVTVESVNKSYKTDVAKFVQRGSRTSFMKHMV